MLDTEGEPNLICKSILTLKWCDCIRHLQNLSLNQAPKSQVHEIGKIMLFFQLGDVQMRVHFGIIGKLAMPPSQDIIHQ